MPEDQAYILLFKFNKIIKGMFGESNRMDVTIDVHDVQRIFWEVINPMFGEIA